MADVGSTRPAGEGVSDEQMSEQVAEQTSSDLDAEDVFERDASGVDDPTEAAKESADEVESDG
jgi:hypothetical protein